MNSTLSPIPPSRLNRARTESTPGTLCEFERYRPRPGDPDWPRLAAEAREQAARLRPTLASPDKRRDARRRAQSFATASRNYLENRRLHRAGREDLRPLYFIWTLLRRCNFTCSYCCDHTGQKYPELPEEHRLTTQEGRELLRVMRTRTPSVYFAGGEPTLRKDLPELTEEASRLGYYPIVVNTNGSAIDRLLRKSAWRSWLAQTDMVVVSLDGLNLEELSRVWEYDRPEDVLRNLLLLRELADEMRVKLMVNCVIRPGHIAEARAVLDLANDLGIWFCPVPQNVGPRVHGALHESADYQALVETILERKREGLRVTGSLRLLERLLRSEPLTCRNTLKPHIDYDGSLVWPCKSSVNVAPERLRVLDHADVDALYAAASELVDPTRFKGPAKNQCGADCNWAQNYSTDAYRHGLEHPLSLLRETIEFAFTR
ncbi:MAG: radical SAM protein [Deltaproteobacteria bacterium]|nr:radical SAM protein [Deltaproteobacteria bacterium]